MKQRIKNNKLIILAMCAILSLFMGFASLSGANFTRADETSANANTFEMISSAEVRTEDPYGLRFKVRVGSAVKDAIEAVHNTDGETNKGFLIFPKQYLSSVTGENPDYKNKNNGGLIDYIDLPIGDGTWYYEVDDDDNKTGYFLYNGVIHTIKEQNRSLEYAAIAYYKNADGNYVYADFDNNFGRSITYVLSKGYLNSVDVRTTISECFYWFGTADYPVSIESEDDMFSFAEAVNGGETFEGKYFKLNNDLSLDGWTAIRSGFAGTLDCNGKTVTLLSGGDKFVECGTVTKTNDTVVGDKQYAFKATAGSAKNFATGSKTGELVENSNIENKSADYTGNAAKLENCTLGSVFTVTLNYTKEELTALKSDYNAVTVSFMLTGTATDSSQTASFNDNVGSDGYASDNVTPVTKHAGIISKTGLTNNIAINKWHTYTITLDDLIATMGLELKASSGVTQLAENQALLTRTWHNNVGYVDAYVGDIVLSKPEYGMTMTEKYNGRIIANNSTANNVIYYSNENLSDKNNYTGNAVAFTVAGGSKYSIKMNYSAKDYAKLGDIYNTVVFNVYFDVNNCGGTNYSINDNVQTSAVFKNTDFNSNKSEWGKIEVSLDVLITAMGGSDSDSKECILFQPWIGSGTTGYTVYLGDIVFSNKTVE